MSSALKPGDKTVPHFPGEGIVAWMAIDNKYVHVFIDSRISLVPQAGWAALLKHKKDPEPQRFRVNRIGHRPQDYDAATRENFDSKPRSFFSRDPGFLAELWVSTDI